MAKLVVMRHSAKGTKPVAIIPDGNYSFRLWRFKRGWNSDGRFVLDSPVEVIFEAYGMAVHFYTVRIVDAAE